MKKLTCWGMLVLLAACSGGEQQQSQAAAAPSDLNTGAVQAAPAAPVAIQAAAEPPKPATDLKSVAGAYRWTSGFGQGISEALVSNVRDEQLNISVQADSEYNDGTEVEGNVLLTLKPEIRSGEEFYVLVGDRTFTFEEGNDSAETASGRRQMADLISTLKATKAAYVTVEVPGRNYSTAFSTKGLAAAL